MDSNPPAAQEAERESTGSRYSPYIAGVILDYSREFGDVTHGPQNIHQALRLWQQHDLGEEDFVGVLHEARARTRRAQGAQGTGSIAAKMAYYFRVVEDLLSAAARAGK